MAEESALYKKFRAEQDAADAAYKSWEAEEWKKNGAEWSKQGYTRTVDPNSAWGSTWSYIKPKNPVSSTPPTDPSKEEESAYAKAKREGTVNLLIGRTQPEEKTEQTPLITEHEFRNNAHFRNHHFLKDNANITIEGKTYPIMVTTGLYNNSYGVENDRTYAFNPETGLIRAVFENFTGSPHNSWATNSEWITPGWMTGPEYEWKKANPMPNMRSSLGGGYTPEYKQWLSDYKKAKTTGFKKQGGTMNRINYFQQGGVAPLLGNVQEQVISLVQAAMSGDQKATQTVNQIMEAAKAGDLQAMLLAQMIQQVVLQMQGQATYAKWGSKLQYLKSLKYARGGKTCPACMKEGGETKKDKKVKVAYKDIDNETYQKMGTWEKGQADVHRDTKSTSWNKDGTYTTSHKPDASDSTTISRSIMSKNMSRKYPEKKECGGKAKKHYFGGWL